MRFSALILAVALSMVVIAAGSIPVNKEEETGEKPGIKNMKKEERKEFIAKKRAEREAKKGNKSDRRSRQRPGDDDMRDYVEKRWKDEAGDDMKGRRGKKNFRGDMQYSLLKVPDTIDTSSVTFPVTQESVVEILAARDYHKKQSMGSRRQNRKDKKGKRRDRGDGKDKTSDEDEAVAAADSSKLAAENKAKYHSAITKGVKAGKTPTELKTALALTTFAEASPEDRKRSMERASKRNESNVKREVDRLNQQHKAEASKIETLADDAAKENWVKETVGKRGPFS